MLCQSCQYTLRGLTTSKCPECGREFNPRDPSTYLEDPPSAPARAIQRYLGIRPSELGYLLRRAAILFVVFAVLGIIIGGYMLYRAVNNTMRAEERLQATRVVGDLIADYVEKNPAHAWPTSWADLEKLPHQGCMFRWPEQAAEYKAIVTIDFATTTAKVLQQTPANCTAVTVTPGPNFSGFPQQELQPLFARLHELPAPDSSPRKSD